MIQWGSGPGVCFGALVLMATKFAVVLAIVFLLRVTVVCFNCYSSVGGGADAHGTFFCDSLSLDC